MNSIVVTSMERSAGKTSVLVGLARSQKARVGYMKPFGDRPVYQKKRLWDYDASVMTRLFGLTEDPEDMTMGFGAPKLRYMYDEVARKARLKGMAAKIGKGADLLLVEGGSSLRRGSSVGLDAISVARLLGARIVVVIGGNEETLIDDLHFLKRNLVLKGLDFSGVVINKVPSVQDFKEGHLEEIYKLGIKVLGIVPFEKELTYPSVGFLAERLFAKVVTGVGGLDRVVKNVFVGAMSADPANRNNLIEIINKESKLVITSGDRSDMILTALESDTSAILLTNNTLPPTNIISKARDLGVPLLLVSQDTYSVAVQVNDLEPLLSKHDAGKLALVEVLMKDHLDIGEILRS